MILFINACVRPESRTRRLAERLLARLSAVPGQSDAAPGKIGAEPAPSEEIREVRPAERAFPPADAGFLEKRDRLLAAGALDDPLFDAAREFAAADTIVVAAPFWDLSFPAALKQYLEQITVQGITFRYSPEGIPQGLCRARKLYYIMTAGGPINTPAFGYGYVDALAKGFFRIPETVLLKAEGLDMEGADVEEILRRVEADIDRLEI